MWLDLCHSFYQRKINFVWLLAVKTINHLQYETRDLINQRAVVWRETYWRLKKRASNKELSTLWKLHNPYLLHYQRILNTLISIYADAHVVDSEFAEISGQKLKRISNFVNRHTLPQKEEISQNATCKLIKTYFLIDWIFFSQVWDLLFSSSSSVSKSASCLKIEGLTIH